MEIFIKLELKLKSNRGEIERSESVNFVHAFPLMIINKHGLELTFERIKIIADFRFQIFRVPERICLCVCVCERECVCSLTYSHKDMFAFVHSRA